MLPYANSMQIVTHLSLAMTAGPAWIVSGYQYEHSEVLEEAPEGELFLAIPEDFHDAVSPLYVAAII